ncbi:MAG TPA: class I SAM-dependent methyltransferase [Candidatus Acidoferrales bacterium]|nr:class I SAM-dependent methyltransferase [Candidatus Acidoferrales bacterium]
MSNHVCPWWLGYLQIIPFRRWQYDPTETLRPYVREGMTVLEPGPGMGFFTIPLARLVGASGRVVAVDLQPKMIAGLKRRAAKAGVLDRIDARVVSADTMGLDDLAGKVDFTLAFAMVHEFPDAQRFFTEVARASKPAAAVLLAEPRGHVKESNFEAELASAATAQFEGIAHPVIRRSHAAVLRKK